MLFNIFFSALEENIKSSMVKFSGDAKISGVANKDMSVVQKNLD